MAAAATYILSILSFVLFIAVLAMGIGLINIEKSQEADRLRLATLESKEASYDQLREHLSSLDSNLDQLEALLDPEGHKSLSPGTTSTLNQELVDGNYPLEMIDPRDCNSLLPGPNLAVCIESMTLSKDSTVLHVSIASSEETTFYSDDFRQNCYLEDNLGKERIPLDALQYNPTDGQTPGAAIHKGETIYRDLKFARRLDGSARSFQLFWPGSPNGAMIRFGITPSTQ